MISLKFTITQECAMMTPLLAPISLATNFIEEKYKSNSYIRTLCRVVQSVPLAYLVSEKVRCMGTEITRGSCTQGDTFLSWSVKKKRPEFLHMSQAVLVALMLLPVVNTALKKLADSNEYNWLKSIINSFNKFYVTAVKVTNLAIIAFGLIESKCLLSTKSEAIEVLYISTISLSLIWNAYLSYQTLIENQK